MVGWLASQSDQDGEVLRKVPIWEGRGEEAVHAVTPAPRMTHSPWPRLTLEELLRGETNSAGLAHPECSVALREPLGAEAGSLRDPSLAPPHA